MEKSQTLTISEGRTRTRHHVTGEHYRRRSTVRWIRPLTTTRYSGRSDGHARVEATEAGDVPTQDKIFFAARLLEVVVT